MPVDYDKYFDEAVRATLGPDAKLSDRPAAASSAGPGDSLSSTYDRHFADAYKNATGQDYSRRDDPPPASKKEAPAVRERTLTEDLARVPGLTARMVAKSVAQPVAMLADAVTGPINSALDFYDEKRAPTMSELVTNKKQPGFRFRAQMPVVDEVLTSLGLPQADTPVQRVVEDIGGAMGGAGASVAAGRVLAKGAGAVTRAVGDTLAAAPGAQIAASGASGGASGTTREMGGGAGAQVAAGLVGALAPNAGWAGTKELARRSLRGGEAGRVKVAENIQAFKDASGSPPTLGQATGGRWQQAVESGLSKFPGGSGVMAKKSAEQADALGTSVRATADELAPGASAVDGGEAIVSGVNEFKNKVLATQTRLYDRLDKHLPADTPITVNRTQEALESLNQSINGAESVSGMFKNGRVAGIARALQEDLQNSAEAALPAGGSLMNPGPPNLQTATLPYEAIKKLRSLVGREIEDSSLMSDVPRSKLRALYGALSEDLGDAAAAAGANAQGAWRLANDYTRGRMRQLEKLDPVVKRDTPEKVFSALTSGSAEGDTQARRILGVLPTEQRKTVVAAVLQRLGRANAGAQNAEQDAFSSETFLTGLSKMSPAARDTIFKNSGIEGLGEKIDAMAKMASTSRDSKGVLPNPSGTASSAVQMTNAAAMASGFTLGVATGTAAPIVGAVAPSLGAYAGAKFVSSPGVVQFAGSKTDLPRAAIPSAVNAVGRSDGGGLAALTGAPPKPTTDDILGAGSVDEAIELAKGAAGLSGTRRPDGTFLITGDPQEARAKLRDAGIQSGLPHQSGLLVGRSNAEAAERLFQQRPVETPQPAEMPAPAVREPSDVDMAAREAAAALENERRGPTSGQFRAGNFKMASTSVGGIQLNIEHPEGSVRTGVDEAGQPWESETPVHRGYVKGTRDGDNGKLVALVAPGTPKAYGGAVYVIDQKNPRSGEFDQHVAVFGAENEEQASAMYRAGYPKDWQGAGAITKLPLPVFKVWSKSDQRRGPIGD